MQGAGPPNPTLLYRLVHVDNLVTLLTRGSAACTEIDTE
jgi:hypothetical protein